VCCGVGFNHPVGYLAVEDRLHLGPVDALEVFLVPDVGGASMHMHRARHAGHIVNETRHYRKIVAGDKNGKGKLLFEFPDK